MLVVSYVTDICTFNFAPCSNDSSATLLFAIVCHFYAATVRFPGAEDIPSGFAALSATPAMVWVQMAFTWGMMEAINRDAFGKAEFPGDFRNGFLDFGWDKFDDETKMKKRSIELNNGRAAQMGILGLMVHENLGNLNDILP